MKKKITIVDYGSGNLLSVKQSFVKVTNLNNINAEIKISNDPRSLKESSHLVLPGQGAFKTCMDGIKKHACTCVIRHTCNVYVCMDGIKNMHVHV